MNIPSTVGGNWQWRMVGGELTDELAERIRSLTETYGRIVPEPKPKSEKPKKAK
jgi:4-alpha-glucanotransferase